MRNLLLFLITILLLGASPTWAMRPLSSVVVPSGTTTTFTGAPNRGTGAVTTYNNNFYQSIEILSGGVGVFNDGENVGELIVRTGGTVRFGVNGEISSANPNINSSATNNLTLEPGAIVQLANPNGLPFATGYYNANNPNDSFGNGNGPALPYNITGVDGAYYTFQGSAAQTTTAPADAARGGGTRTTASGIALPGTVARLSFSNNGGFNATVTVTNNTSVTQELHVVSGRVIVASGATLSTVSTSTSTTVLDYNSSNGGGSVEGPGTFAIQRYIDGSLNSGTGYRHLAVPLTNATVASFANGSFTPRVNAAYNSNPTLPAASFPTVFSYDETKVGGGVGPVGFDQGWQSPAALTDALTLGRGYTVNMPPTSATGATLTFVGTPSNQGAQFNSLGHTTANGGYHLLGNPFGAPLDWNNVVSSGTFYGGLATALYVFKSNGQYAGSYTTYVPAAPSNTGTNVVPMGQAFFVYNPTVGSQGRVTFIPSQTITSYSAAVAGTPVQRSAAETRTYLRLALQDAAAHAHETLVYFDPAATPGFDRQYDATYLAGAGQPVSVSTEQGGQSYAVNALPTLGAADVTVPLRLAAATAGTYTLQVAALENLPAGTHAYLLDAATGQRQDLATTPTASVTLAANAPLTSRYSLLFSTSGALATAPAALARLAMLYPNPAHGTTALLLPAALRAGQPTPVAILNALGQVVRTATATADELALPLDGLAAGLYTVQARTAAGTVSRRLTVE
ncbi:T9SS type A sorting domain-containing protein [Hymenobacter ruricola]|uniref:T9SS type A sorting domain-containing protein n=1 Tax=Hymenobacter ruricola TaxID=2791023 RepID=A0ABS0IAW4_9BACT|nr:T9SS type A sorting domain-containing protein [Hymenobacter ruricola]MBF9223712.1 T9SS type A sorting domain-containing protein [Hymenobacter ruricola]